MTSTQAIDRLRQVLRRQHKALAKEDCYCFWVRRYIGALRSMPKDMSSEKKLERFLTGSALRYNLAASTQNQAFNSVLFFYKEAPGQSLGNVDALRAKRPAHERQAPSIRDTRLLLQAIRNENGYPMRVRCAHPRRASTTTGFPAGRLPSNGEAGGALAEHCYGLPRPLTEPGPA
jgi:hypothetical protein